MCFSLLGLNMMSKKMQVLLLVLGNCCLYVIGRLFLVFLCFSVHLLGFKPFRNLRRGGKV